MMPESTAIIIGASGGLGSALYRRWQRDHKVDHVIAISRQAVPDDVKSRESSTHFIQCDYTESSIAKACEKIRMLTGSISRVCICNGILHNEHVWPEKRIEDVNLKHLQQVFAINSIVPMLWLKALLTLVKGQSDCVISVFSARIGSIDDNRSGGWYSYRASKAALNMLLKTAAIEYARRAKNVKLIAFHPGTTDTALSKPFQRSVSPDSLFTTEFVAEHLVNIMNNQTVDGELSFIDWENEAIAW